MFGPLLVSSIALVLSRPANLDAQLDSQPILDGASYSVTVADADGTVLYQRNSGQRLVPASNQKLVTCLYALNSLGVSFQQRTRVWCESNRTIIDAPGDPSLTRQDWLDLSKSMPYGRNHPVSVRQAYRVGVPDTWEFDDLPNRYAARVTALSFDRAGFEVWAENGLVDPLPTELAVKVDWKGGTGNPKVNYDVMRGTVTIEGALPSKRTQLETFAIPEPDRAVARMLGYGFNEASSVPTSSPTKVLTSPPLIQMVKDCLQPSDNHYAEQLLMLTSAQLNGGTTTYGQARSRAQDFLFNTVGASKSDFQVMDGSGMSRHNMVTTRGLVQLLTWARRQPWYTEFRSSLAQPGVGTLKSRLQGIEFYGKTGTLSGVNSLSGYIKTASGKDLTFSMVVNNTLGPSSNVRDSIDAIVRTIENAGFDGTGIVVK